MLIYVVEIILIAILMLLSPCFSSRVNRILILSYYVFISIVSGLRYGIGSDYFTYQNIFDNSLLYSVKNLEIGFMYLNKIFKYYNMDFKIFVFFMAILTNFIIYLTLKNLVKNNYEKFYIATFLYITTGLYFTSFNAIKQMLGFALSLLSIKLLSKNKRVKYVISILVITFLFNYVAIVLLPLVFLKDININSIKSILLYLGLIFSIAISTQTINKIFNLIFKIFPKYQIYAYILNNLQRPSNKLNIVIPTVILFTVFFFKLFYLQKIKIDNIYFHMYLIYYVLILLSTTFDVVLVRVAIYYSTSVLIMIPEIVSCFKSEDRVLLKLLLIFIFVPAILIQLLHGINQIVPYSNIFA